MFDVVVVGSGYGGSIMAARLSKVARVLLVERGRRWRTGEFPSTLPKLATAYMSRRNPLGLWAMRFGPGTGNAFASGLGGASLVNYGITARPDDHVFDSWPVSASQWSPYFERALEALQPTPNPIANQLGDQQFLDYVEPGRRVDLVNTIDWDKCTQCGHCCPGCNVGAKRSLDRTFIATAEENGAEIRTRRTVERAEKLPDGGWELSLRVTDGRDIEKVRTRHLVLAAGTFGTLDFLNKNRDTLPTTAMFGQQITMNGDGVAFMYNTRFPLSGHHGAPITTSARIPFADGSGKQRTLTVMSGRIPFSMMRLSAALMTFAADAVPGEVVGSFMRDNRFRRLFRRVRDLAVVDRKGALAHTFMYKLDAEDSARGTVCFNDKGESAVDWPDYSEDPILAFAQQRLEEWAHKVGGRVIDEVGSWPHMKGMGVHPLGGCRMGRDAGDGVVDDRCRLLEPDGKPYPGVRVVDASVIASALGVPSSLMVSAIAERAADDMTTELRRS